MQSLNRSKISGQVANSQPLSVSPPASQTTSNRVRGIQSECVKLLGRLSQVSPPSASGRVPRALFPLPDPLKFGVAVNGEPNAKLTFAFPSLD